MVPQRRKNGIVEKMNVSFEPPVPPHAPELYQSAATVTSEIDGWDEFTIDAELTYGEHGYLVVRGALSPEQVATAREELRAMTLADDPGCAVLSYEGSLPAHLRRTDNLTATERAERALYVRKFMTFTAQHPPLAAIAHLPELRHTIAMLTHEPMVLFQEMALLKPPGGREKPWHQDHAYFNLPIETPIVGAWIALEDVRPENGCMFVLAGGHTAGPRLHFQRRDWQLCDTEAAGFVSTAVPMQAGDLLLFDGKLPHGTPVNQTDETRWALQFHYIPRETIVADEALRLATFGADGKGVSC